MHTAAAFVRYVRGARRSTLRNLGDEDLACSAWHLRAGRALTGSGQLWYGMVAPFVHGILTLTLTLNKAFSAKFTIESSLGVSAGARPADCWDPSGMRAISFSRLAVFSWNRENTIAKQQQE